MREANYVVHNPYFRSSGKRAGFPGDSSPERIRLKGAYGEWIMVVPEDVPCMWSFRRHGSCSSPGTGRATSFVVEADS